MNTRNLFSVLDFIYINFLTSHFLWTMTCSLAGILPRCCWLQLMNAIKELMILCIYQLISKQVLFLFTLNIEV